MAAVQPTMQRMLACGLCDVAMRLQTSPATKVLATYLQCPRSWSKARVMQHVMSVGGPTAACRVDFVTNVSPGPAPAIAPNATPVPATAPTMTSVPLAPLLVASAGQAYAVVPPASSAWLPSPTSASPVSSQWMGTSAPLQAARVGRVAGDLDGLSESVKAVVAHSAVAGRVRDVIARWTLGMHSGGISASDIGTVYKALFEKNVKDDIMSEPGLCSAGVVLSLYDLLRCLPDVVEELSASTRTMLYRVVGYGGAGGGAGTAAGAGGDHAVPAAGALGPVAAPHASAPLWQLAWIRLDTAGAEGKPIYARLQAAPDVEHDGVVVKFFRKVHCATHALWWLNGNG
jgi:hypothetical protein